MTGMIDVIIAARPLIPSQRGTLLRPFNSARGVCMDNIGTELLCFTIVDSRQFYPSRQLSWDHTSMRLDAEIRTSCAVLNTEEVQKKDLIQLSNTISLALTIRQIPLNMLGICGPRLSCHQIMLSSAVTTGYRGDDITVHTTSNILRVQWA